MRLSGAIGVEVSPKKDFARKHDIILRYSLGPPTVNVDAVRIPFSEDSTDRLKYRARSFRKGATYDTYRPNPKGKTPGGLVGDATDNDVF